MAKAVTTMIDSNGNAIPLKYVSAYDKARDRATRRILARFEKARATLETVVADSIKDLDELAKLKESLGAKGNFSARSFDGLIQVAIRQQYNIRLDERVIRARELMLEYVGSVLDRVNGVNVSAAAEVGEKAEDYRRRILREELGAESLSEVSRGSGFDKLMARVCIDSGDFERAVKYSSQTLSRMRHLIVEAATKIVRANGFSGTSYAYIAGVMVQAKMSQQSVAVLSERLVNESAWMQFTEGQLKRLLMMLQTHLRRI